MLNTGSLGTVGNSRVSDRVADMEGLQPCVAREIAFYNSECLQMFQRKEQRMI